MFPTSSAQPFASQCGAEPPLSPIALPTSRVVDCAGFDPAPHFLIGKFGVAVTASARAAEPPPAIRMPALPCASMPATAATRPRLWTTFSAERPGGGGLVSQVVRFGRRMLAKRGGSVPAPNGYSCGFDASGAHPVTPRNLLGMQKVEVRVPSSAVRNPLETAVSSFPGSGISHLRGLAVTRKVTRPANLGSVSGVGWDATNDTLKHRRRQWS